MKKWQLTYNALRRWAEGRTIYVDNYNAHPALGHLYHPVRIERLLRLTEEGTVVEFCAGDDDDDEYREGDIARVSLEGLALTGEGFDSEYCLRYYTAERLADEDPDCAALLGIAPAEP